MLLLFLSPSLCDAADDLDPASSQGATDYKIEWFGARLGGGNYGMGLELSFFTLRWEEYVYLTVLQGGAIGLRGLAGWVGPTIGFPLELESSGRHEIRIGLSPLFSKFLNGPHNRPSGCGHEADDATGMMGFSLGPEISYLYHVNDTVSIQAGGRVIIGIAGMKDPGDCHPYPAGFGFIGVVL